VTERFNETVATLRAAGCVYAEDEARLLLEAGGSVDELVARRVAGEPLEWILGWAWFGTEDGDGLRVLVHPGVFVPRGRTIELALAALDVLPADGTVVELCCGSGAISAYLLHAAPSVSVYAADLDPVATACARENLPGSEVFEGDLFASLPTSLRGTVDVVVANTPYVPSDQVALMPPEARDHEPLHTLDGGRDGLALLRRIAGEVRDWLKPGGVVLIEISESQYDAARAAFESAELVTSARIDPDGTSVILGQA
jgi:release factor glutamine methyltransferase